VPDYLDSHWPPPLSFFSARRRRYAIGAAIVTPIVPIGMLSNLHPRWAPDRGIAALMRAVPMLARRSRQHESY
jgi:hypothetical protein